ncbi:hypothetical protein Poli38472_005454 [Pythium oligandrum]|uniref:Uncharacterized protein n=1 Tax=Pythium oligandrum TaxID=41045 RepID=A0A8K1FHK5_PYTOL|nr:hypothetical protein Poli38472_005454 [Pythium oligandrum]|eukprot:TMW62836.1 hypothetical protein Poli38472_005454 [Pythium oligandrum]
MNVWVSASDGDSEAVKKYLADGGDVNAKDEFGYTPLQAAVSYNHIELVQFLLASGASATLADNDLDTPLHRAETVDCAKILLHHGAQLNARNSEERTPFDAATEEGHTELIAFYESLGAEKSDITPDEDEPQEWNVNMAMEE